MKAGIVVFPGSNCDRDVFHVCKDILDVHTEYLWHKDADLKDVDLIILPGGFSFGDHLRAGIIASFSPIIDKVLDFIEKGGLVLGICNGFQILLELGILPGILRRNIGMKFICKNVLLKVENCDTPFTNVVQRDSVLKIPVAHYDGNYYLPETKLREINENKQVVFRYTDDNGITTPQSNPNGSISNIAGIINRKGNVLGLMPHPERASSSLLGSEDGLLIFKSVKKYLSL